MTKQLTKKDCTYSLLQGNRKHCTLFTRTMYYSFPRFSFAVRLFFSDREHFVRTGEGQTACKDRSSTSFLQHADSSILLIAFTLVETHFQSTTNNLCKTCLERNAGMVTELLSQIVQLHVLPSAHSHSNAEFLETAFQTISYTYPSFHQNASTFS